jgi:hypothetical protein
MAPSSVPDLLPIMEPLRAWLGRWRGSGAGEYPTIEPFAYHEEVEIGHNGKPFLAYQQRTRHADDGRPLHAESGYIRLIGEPDASGAVPAEAVIAHPTGISEILEGDLDGGRLVLATTAVARTPTAKVVTAVERMFVLDGDVLSYEVRMAAVGQPLQHHLGATLHRVV